jgi:hypothetical protein
MSHQRVLDVAVELKQLSHASDKQIKLSRYTTNSTCECSDIAQPDWRTIISTTNSTSLSWLYHAELRTVLNAVLLQCAVAQFQPRATCRESVLVRRNVVLILNQTLHIVDSVVGLEI